MHPILTWGEVGISALGGLTKKGIRPLCQSLRTILPTVCKSGSPPWKVRKHSQLKQRTEPTVVLGAFQLSQLRISTCLPSFIWLTLYSIWNTPHYPRGLQLIPVQNLRPKLTFSNFPVRKASFSRKSSAFSQESILYVLLIYSGFARSSTAPMWSSGVLIFSTWT